MKQTIRKNQKLKGSKASPYLLARIASIQNELETLKKGLRLSPFSIKYNTYSLYGVWKDHAVSEREIAAAKKSLFKNV